MAPKYPLLQVALDMENLHRAMAIASEAVRGGASLIEAGTPLIKSEGMEAVRQLKKKFPTCTIIADTKTSDVGGFEVEIAAKSGADIVSILGIADNATITEAVLAARKFGAQIMIDMIGVIDRKKRARQVEKLGVDYICVHVGIDQQMVGGDPAEQLRDVYKVCKIPIAVAGGLNSQSIPKMLKAGASIIIVGGALTKSRDVTGETRKIMRVIKTGKGSATRLYKKYSKNNLARAFKMVSTPHISDAMHRMGAMKGIIPRIKPGTKMVGRAVPVRTHDGDWAKSVEAIDRADKGDVIVVDAGRGHSAVWGELATWSAIKHGVSGVVIDGAARDVKEINDLGFPLFSTKVAPNAGEPKGHGEIGSEIVCGGISVRRGDWIIGDENGVVVVPAEKAVEIANRAIDIMERENRLREEIKRGSSLSIVQKLEKWEKIG